MSTTDTIELPLCPCPCGQGQVIRRITTQDNPWSSADIEDFLKCPHCQPDWQLDGSNFTLRSSATPYREASVAEEKATRALTELVQILVNGYFDRFAAPTKKAQHDEMLRLSITSLNYRQYLSERRKGRSPAQCCWGLNNKAWLQSLAAAQSKETELERLIAASETTRAAASDAYKQIVRRPLNIEPKILAV